MEDGDDILDILMEDILMEDIDIHIATGGGIGGIHTIIKIL